MNILEVADEHELFIQAAEISQISKMAAPTHDQGTECMFVFNAVVDFVAEESSTIQKMHQIPSDFPYRAEKHD